MAIYGPRPQPTALRVLNGNPGRRPLNDREPKPGAGAPRCPPYLDEEAKRQWKRLLPILRRMKVLTEADFIALGNLCQTYSTMIKAQTDLTKAGLLYKTQSGYIQQSPLLSIVSQYVETITRLCREFGLTPSSRSRILAQSEEKSKSGGLLNGQWQKRSS